jgi:hypothetical protein
VVLSVCPLAGAGTGSLVRSDTEIWSASARARTSLRVGERLPRSIRFRVSLLIPANPATIRSDLPRSSRTRYSAHPIVRASSAPIRHHFVHRVGSLTDSPRGRRPGTLHSVRDQAACRSTRSSVRPPRCGGCSGPVLDPCRLSVAHHGEDLSQLHHAVHRDGSSPRRRSPRTDIAERGTAYVSQQRHSLRGECLSSTASTSRVIGSRNTRRAELS